MILSSVLSTLVSPHNNLRNKFYYSTHIGFPGGSNGKESACSAKDPGLIPGARRSAAEGNGYPLQCSCLENPMDRGARRVLLHGVTKSEYWLSTYHVPFINEETEAHISNLPRSCSK